MLAFAHYCQHTHTKKNTDCGTCDRKSSVARGKKNRHLRWCCAGHEHFKRETSSVLHIAATSYLEIHLQQFVFYTSLKKNSNLKKIQSKKTGSELHHDSNSTASTRHQSSYRKINDIKEWRQQKHGFSLRVRYTNLAYRHFVEMTNYSTLFA